MEGLARKGMRMRKRLCVAACVLLAALVFGLAGCAGGGPEKIISGGYIPNGITNIEGGGEFDASKLTPHESNELSLGKIEGFWIHENFADNPNAGLESKDGSVAVTEKTITLNDGKIECLPKSIDIRPYSPMKTLISQGFGYGAAIFQKVADDSNSLGIHEIQAAPTMPYMGNGFICTTNGNTLALGFVNAEAELDEYGMITDKEDKTAKECTLTEVDYEMSLDGNRLTLSYGDVKATYVQQSTALYQMHKSPWNGEPLFEGNSKLSILGQSPKDLPSKGFKLDCDTDEMMESCSISKEFSIKTPGGTTLSAKVVNPYEKTVPIGYSKICWYGYEGGKSGGVTIGMPSTYEGSHTSQEFGVTPYSDVYNYYELPYEQAEGLLSYKAGYRSTIQTITALGKGYDTGDTLLESEHSCEIRLNFADNVLSSISVGDPVYVNGGLQDNIAHDDLDGLKPSVYREATEQRDKILDELKKAFKSAGVDAAINEKTGAVVMDNNVLFASDSYELGDDGKAYLDKVFTAYASVVLDDKYSSALKDIAFEGNTDSDGDPEYNMRLSESRANAVMQYCSSLLDDKKKATFDGLAACKGYGESDLVYDETGNENKEASRRVAIKFMMKVDSLNEEAESQTDNGGSGSAASSSSSSSSSASSGASSSSGTQTGSDELTKFRDISSKFDQAWRLYEEGDGGSKRAVVLLLSKDHDYCAYADLKTDTSSSTTASYTFGEATVGDKKQNTEAITVHHTKGDDKLDIIFNARGKANMVSVRDPWKETHDLTSFDTGTAISFFEDILNG